MSQEKQFLKAIRTERIAQLRALPDQIQALVADLSQEELTTHYLENEWTVAQNVHHVVDSHMNSYVRCKLMATEKEPPLKPYDQDAWAVFGDASGADLQYSMMMLRGLHERWAQFWETLPDNAWSRVGHHPESGAVSLDEQLGLYVEHGLAHIDQIERTLDAK